MKSETKTSGRIQAVPLAVIGLGCLFPKASSTEAYWANILKGVDGVTDLPETHWRSDDYFDPDPKARDKVYASRGGFLSPVDINPLDFGVSPRDVEAIDTTQLLGLIAAREALVDAGYGPDRDFDRSRVSVLLGVTGALEMVVNLGARMGRPHWRRALDEAGVDPATSDWIVERISSSYVEWQENSFPGLLGNVAAGRIANRLDLGGSNCVVDAACASSLAALHLAGLELSAGRADMVVAGGMDTFNDVFMYACFSKTPALSPTGEARPFSDRADGTILGEGLGVVILKRLDDARRDGDRVYAVITGVGSSSDGKGEAVYAPSVKGQVQALRRAYEQAGIGPEAIELIEAHGTGTKVGDAVEIQALLDVYGTADREGSWCALGSVKSQIGHAKAAAGSAGLIKAVLSLHHKILPPTIKVDRPPEALAPGKTPFYVNTAPRPWLPSPGRPRRAAVSSFGFGGSNFHVVLEEDDAAKPGHVWDDWVALAALSGPDKATLKNALALGAQNESWDDFSAWAGSTLNDFDPTQDYRLVLVAEKDRTDPGKLFADALSRLNAAEEGPLPPAEGVFYGHGDAPGLLGLIFPGQGSQYPGMFRDLACRFPEMHRVLVDADSGFEDGASGLRLSDYIYPHPAFSPEERAVQEEALKNTRIAQPAIGAVALGLLRVLEYFGLAPDLAAGHSYGELAALCAAGRFNETDLHALSRLRGTLMARTNGRPGSMLAVMAPAEQTLDLIKANGLDLAAANKNAPGQTVVSGAVPEIERAEKVFTEQGIRNIRLKVSNAFHSPLMAEAHGEFRQALGRVGFAAATMPVYANSTAEPYPEAEESAREILAGQLVNPVEFISQITNMHDSGVRVFLEVGPGRTLTGLVRSILDGKDFQAIPVDASQGKRAGGYDLAKALAALAALGYDLDLSLWGGERVEAPEPKPAFTVRISGANQFKPKEIPPLPAKKNIQEPRPVNSAPQAPPVMAQSPAAQPAQPPVSQPAPPVADTGALARALSLTQENMKIIQEFQAKTAEVHQQFLAGQETAQKNLEALINQQQQLLQGALGAAPSTMGAGYQPPLSVEPAQAAPDPVRTPEPASAVPAPAPKPSSGQAPAASSGLSRETVTAALLKAVSEQTGYPVEMLNLEMGLDADLGIDSIKRVEILSVLSERLPGAPVVGPEQLGTLSTLAQVLDFLSAGAGSSAAPAASSGLSRETVTAELLKAVSEQTGYPVEMLNLEMGLDADLGIDSIKRVEILSVLSERLPGAPVVGPEQLGTLSTLAQVVDFLSAGAGSSAAPAASSGLSRETVTAELLKAVAEQTGYPVEMLNLEMGLDADLGIDSIKRVEILSVLSERLPGAPVVGPEQLGTLSTLAQVVDFLSAGADSSAAPAASSGLPRETVTAELLKAVAEQTGYPVEMLNLEMGLDADLGIDSIKRVEILSVLSERLPGAPVVGPEQLGTLSTLAQVVDFLSSSGLDGAAPAAGDAGIDANETFEPQPGQKPDPGKPAEKLVRTMLEVASGLTGFPVESLGLEQDLQSELGLDPVRLVEIVRGVSEKLETDIALEPGELGRARTLMELARLIQTVLPTDLFPGALGVDRYELRAEPLPDRPNRLGPPLPSGPVLVIREESGLAEALGREMTARGHTAEVIDMDEALSRDLPRDLAGLVIMAPSGRVPENFPEKAFSLVKKTGPALRAAAPDHPSVLVSVSRLDGRFGLDGLPGQGDPWSGALAGLVKTAGWEWPEVRARALDVPPLWDEKSDLASRLADEILADGPIEVGLSDQGRFGLALERRDLPDVPEKDLIQPGELVLISGGARGVTARAALALAAKWKPTLAILARSPEPGPEPEWLEAASGEVEVRKVLITRSQGKAKPREIKAECLRIMADREVRSNLDLLRRTGVKVIYRPVDVRDRDAVMETVAGVRAEHGPVRGLVHGAGVLADRYIKDKTLDQFRLVFSTKTAGLEALLAATGEDDLAFLALFSSSTGRFGRVGQSDYAMANEVLNKIARREARRRPDCRIASFNWGPWAGGMVNASLEKVFKKEGLSLVPMDGGAAHLVRELTLGDGAVETVVLGEGSNLPEDAIHPAAAGSQPEPMEFDLSVSACPVLESHVLDAKAVAPLALIMEWLGRAAGPGDGNSRFIGFDRLKVHSRLEMGPEDVRRLRIESSAPEVFKGELSSRACLTEMDEQGTLKAEARAVFGALERRPAPALPDGLRPYDHNGALYTRGRLFHGPPLAGILEIEGIGDKAVVGTAKTSPDPGEWMRRPLWPDWLLDPLALDCAFQMVILWCWETHQMPALPVSASRVRLFDPGFAKGPVRIAVRINGDKSPLIRSDLEFFNMDGDLVARIEGLDCFESESLIKAYQENRLDIPLFPGLSDMDAPGQGAGTPGK